MKPGTVRSNESAAASKRYAKWLNARRARNQDPDHIIRLLRRLCAQRLQPAARDDRVRFYRLPFPGGGAAGCLIAEMNGRFYSEEDLINALKPTKPRR